MAHVFLRKQALSRQGLLRTLMWSTAVDYKGKIEVTNIGFLDVYKIVNRLLSCFIGISLFGLFTDTSHHIKLMLFLSVYRLGDHL